MDRYTRPLFNGAALITIDTQVDFLDGQPFEIPGTSDVLPQMAECLELFRRLKQPIVHVVRLYREDGTNVDLCRRQMVESGTKLVAPGTEGGQLAPEIRPEPDFRLDHETLLAGGIQAAGPSEAVIYKPRWGAFYQTPLENHLADRKITTLVFVGCNFPNCPRTSIYQASERDFRLVLVDDALSGLYTRGVQEMKNIGVNLMTADELRRAMDRT
jgi:nicotinamidase-related amidase